MNLESLDSAHNFLSILPLALLYCLLFSTTLRFCYTAGLFAVASYLSVINTHSRRTILPQDLPPDHDDKLLKPFYSATLITSFG
jgi:hypothetical protein